MGVKVVTLHEVNISKGALTGVCSVVTRDIIPFVMFLYTEWSGENP